MPSTLILDKSYLDGAPTNSVRTLCRERTLLCSETLFYEMMTTDSVSQKRCFGKFPEEPGSFSLLPNVGALLKFEMEEKAHCGALHQHVLPGKFIFNVKLRDGTYEPPAEVAATLKGWSDQVEQDARSFLERCQSVHHFFPDLIGIEFRDFPAAVASAKNRISTNPDEVRRVFDEFDKTSLPPGAPAAHNLTEEWAWYRWVQCQVFAALRFFERYQCRVPSNPTPAVLTRAEHSMHDLEYVLLGSLAGSLASNDDEVIEDFQLARPTGQLITTRAR